MIIRGNERGLLSNTLLGDKYMLKEMPQNGISWFVDIGANLGFISILARLLHPEMRILAVEPCKSIYDEMVDNVRNLKIKTLNSAYGDGREFRQYKARKTSMNNQFFPDELCNDDTGNKDKDHAKIKSMRLNEIFKMGHVAIENYAIKFDCEGAEHYLSGDRIGADMLKKAKYISIEVHPFKTFLVNDFVHWVNFHFDKTHDLEIDLINKTDAAHIKMRRYM